MQGNGYRLEPFTERDISERYVGWLNSPDVVRFLDIRFKVGTHTVESVREYVSSFYRDEEKYMWGIIVQRSGEMIGTTTLFTVDRDDKTAGIGLMIGERQFWGSGASTEVVELLAHFAFDVLHLHRLTGGTIALNHGMNFAYKRLGFVRGDTIKAAYLLENGAHADGYPWELHADAWRERHSHDGS